MLGRLNGVKHLILGNNDDAATAALAGWASVEHYREMTVNGAHVILCHYPFRTWNQKGKGSVNLHGHSHGLLKPDTREYDVGVNAWDYRPVAFETITASRGRKARARR